MTGSVTDVLRAIQETAERASRYADVEIVREEGRIRVTLRRDIAVELMRCEVACMRECLDRERCADAISHTAGQELRMAAREFERALSALGVRYETRWGRDGDCLWARYDIYLL
jgi:hypothetical protein